MRMVDQFDCSEFVAINGKAIQVVIWCGNEVPDSLIPLDRKGRSGKSPSFRVGMKAESFPHFLLTDNYLKNLNLGE